MGAHQDQMRGFARYNASFNQRLFDLISTISDERRKQDMGAFFGSIHGTLNHILLADRIWLGRFAKLLPGMTSLQGAALIEQFSSLGQELCADFSQLRAERDATDALILAWVEQLSDEVLAGSIHYRTSTGLEREHPVWVAVAHMFNHQTHHRGQLTTLLSQLGLDPGVTDFVAYM